MNLVSKGELRFSNLSFGDDALRLRCSLEENELILLGSFNRILGDGCFARDANLVSFFSIAVAVAAAAVAVAITAY